MSVDGELVARSSRPLGILDEQRIFVSKGIGPSLIEKLVEVLALLRSVACRLISALVDF